MKYIIRYKYINILRYSQIWVLRFVMAKNTIYQFISKILLKPVFEGRIFKIRKVTKYKYEMAAYKK